MLGIPSTTKDIDCYLLWIPSRQVVPWYCGLPLPFLLIFYSAFYFYTSLTHIRPLVLLAKIAKLASDCDLKKDLLDACVTSVSLLPQRQPCVNF